MEENFPSVQKKKRFLSIDVFRGIVILIMVFVDNIVVFDNVPAWSKHALDYGLTYVDLGVSFFIFAISLTYHMSFKRRKEKFGSINVYLQFLRRYGALMGFGFLGSVIMTSQGSLFTWGVLQAIGFAGIFTLVFIDLKIMIRLLFSLFFLIIYQLLSNFSVLINGNQMLISDLMLIDRNGGIIGGFGWGIMMLLSTVIGELFENKEMLKILIFGVIFSIGGVISSLIWGISKHRVNISYILLSIGLAILAFCLIWWIYDSKAITHTKSYIFQPLGKNSFLFYVIHGLLHILIVILIPKSIGYLLIVVIGSLNVIFILAIALILDKKEIYFII